MGTAVMAIDNLLHIDHLLAEWGRAAYSVSIGYKSSMATLMRAMVGGGVPLPRICNRDFERIEFAMLQLKQSHPAEYRALKLWYVGHHNSYRRLGKRLGISHTAAGDLYTRALRAVQVHWDDYGSFVA